MLVLLACNSSNTNIFGIQDKKAFEMKTSEEWLARLKSVECSDATFPSKNPALVFDTAKGSIIRGVDGAEYIDFCAGFGVLAFGHNSESLRHAFTERAVDGFAPVTHGMGDVFASRAKVELLATLVDAMPGHITRGSLALTGSQAVEMSVKTALLATQQSGLIVFEHGYHGVEMGILAMTSRADFRKPFTKWLPEEAICRLPFGCSTGEVEEAIKILRSGPFGFAGICVEPIQGRGGVRLPEEGWLAGLAKCSHDAGGLLILDEVFVGLGRTGIMSHSESVDADLVCLGKALGGGLPLSACVGTDAAMSAWPVSEGEAIHTGTFFGHPLSCAVGLATLQKLIDERWCKTSATRGQHIIERWQATLGRFDRVKEVRGRGMMWGVELTQPGAAVQLVEQLRQKQIIALPSGSAGEVVSFTPALNIPEDLLEVGLTAFEATLAES
jgi:4-aminobutyrate aminotransferase-like enzyme